MVDLDAISRPILWICGFLQRRHKVGEFDAGRGYVKDVSGSVIAELNKEGEIKDNAGQSIGKVEGFSYDRLTTMAAYFLLVDRDLLRGL